MGQYVPTGQPVERELGSISQAMQSPNAALFLTPLAVAPLKPREGMVVMANGTNWNPGSGAGFYGYRAGSWRFLG
jgi:hypothetical protein